MRVVEALNQRQDDVDGRFVDPDQNASSTQVTQLLDGGLRLFRQSEQPVGVIAKETPGVGQRGILGGAVEQPFADALLEPSDGLADRRLGAVELHGRAREAPFGGDLQKDA